MEAQPVARGPTESYLGEEYWNISSGQMTRSLNEIRDIVDKHQAKLQRRLVQLEEEYPPATGRLLDMSIDV